MNYDEALRFAGLKDTKRQRVKWRAGEGRAYKLGRYFGPEHARREEENKAREERNAAVEAENEARKDEEGYEARPTEDLLDVPATHEEQRAYLARLSLHGVRKTPRECVA